MSIVITISREFGSGGHTIGRQVAERLGVPFYDSEIVEEIAARSGLKKDFIEERGEFTTRANNWLSNMAKSSFTYYEDTQDKVFALQRQVILDAANKGPCVIVGRCSDYILRQAMVPCLNVFVHAEIKDRAQRVLARYGETDVAIRKRLMQQDKRRRIYYKYYTNQNWGEYPNYDLMLDSGYLGMDCCVDLVIRAAEALEAQKAGKGQDA